MHQTRAFLADSAIARTLLILSLLSTMMLSGEGLRVMPFPPLGSDHDVSLDVEDHEKWMVQTEESGPRDSMESVARRPQHASKKGVAVLTLPPHVAEVAFISTASFKAFPQSTFHKNSSLSSALSGRAPPAV